MQDASSQPTVAQILDAVPHPVFWKDSQGVYLGCNDVFAHTVGLRSAAEIVGKTDFDLPWPRADAEAYRADDRQVIESRQPRRHVVEPLQQADGTRLWVDTTKVPLFAPDGQAYGVLGVHDDITERTQAEEIARQERHFSESAIEAMPGVFYMHDEHGRLLKWNRNLETLTGHTAEGIAGHTVFDLLRPDCWERVTQAMQEVFSKGSAVVEVVVVSRDGHETPYYCHSQCTVLNGRPHVLGMGIDISERKRAETELERTRLLLEAVVEQSPVPMTVAHVPEQTIGYSNRAAREFLGRTDEASCTNISLTETHRLQTWRDIRPDSSPTPTEELPLERTLRGESFTNKEYGVIRKDGTRRWASVSGSPIRGRNGELIAGLIVYPDITEHKQAEQALRESEERFRALFEQAMDGVVLADGRQRTFAQANAKFCEMLGYSRAETLQLGVPNIHPSESLPEVFQMFERLVRRESHNASEVPVLRKDGSVFYADITASSLVLEGQPFLVASFRDITERKRAEQALRQSESMLRSILRAAPIAISIVSLERKFTFINEHTFEVLGYKPEELIGHDTRIVYPSDAECERIRRGVYEELGRTGFTQMEGRMRRKDGREVDVVISGTYVRPDDPSAGIVFTLLDMTERKRAEQALRESENLLRSVFRAAPAAIGIVGLDRKLMFVNERTREVLGYAPEELIGQEARILYPTEVEYERVGRTLYPELQRVGFVQMEGCMGRKNGSTVDVLINGTYLRPDDPSAGVVYTVLDITERKRAEQALRESEARLRGIFRAVPVVIGIIAADRTMDLVNEQMRPVLGYRPEEVMGRNSRMLHASEEEYLRVGRDLYQDLWRTGATQTEGCMRHKDGTEVHMLISAAPLRPDDPSAGSVVTLLDITARKRAEAELERTRLLLEATIEQSPVPTAVANVPDRVVRYANQAALELLGVVDEPSYVGLTLDEVAARQSWQDVRLDGTRVPLADLPLGRALRGEHSRNEEYGIIRKDGTLRWELVSGTPVYDRNGTLVAGLICFPDITDRKHAEQALRAAEERWQFALEGAGDGVWDWNAQTNEVFFSRQWKAMLGYAEHEIGATLAEWENRVHPDDLPRALADVQRHLSGQTATYVNEHRMRCKDGSWKWILDRGKVVSYTPEGRPLRIVGTHTDLTERKRVEEALQQAHRRLDEIIEFLPDATLVIDTHGKVIAWNRAMEQMSGVPKADMIGKGNHEYAIPFYGERRRLLIDLALIPDEEFEKGHYLGVHWQGDILYAEAYVPQTYQGKGASLSGTASRLRDARGNIVGAIESVRDVTERVRAENELRESERKYRALSQEFRTILEAMPGSLVLISPDLKIVWANEFASTSLGLKPGELLGQHCYHCRHNRDEPCEVCAVQRCLVSGKPESGEVEVSDGLIFEVHAAPVRGEQGEIVGAIEAAYDVTEYRRADRELKASESRLRSLFRAAPIGILFSKDRLTVSVNDSLCELLGYSQNELLGKSSRLVYFTQEEYEDVGRKLYGPVSTGGQTSIESRFRRKDGTAIDVLLTGAPLRPEEPAAGFVVTVQDITQRRRAEEERHKLEAQLRQSQKMEAIGQLAGGVAHDFNNILTAVFGQLDLAVQAVESEYPTARNLLDGMHQIERSAQRASALTRQLLAFSRRQVTRPEVLNLNATLRDLEKMLRRLLRESITLEQHLAADLAATKADAGQLEQVIVNLVVNARDAMPDGGRLTLETHNVVLDDSYAKLHPGAQPGEHVVLVVSDTGHGMDRATLERIFEPFFTTKPKGQGTGLGLPTVYGIVRQAGGHVTVYSEPGQGTSFKVYLPAVTEAAAVAKPVRAESGPPGGSETLIICEDDAAVRELTARMLARAGYNVLVATDGAEALGLVAKHAGPIQLLITDVIMPGMNGRQLSEALTAARPGIRTLFVSGYTSNVIAHHGVLDENVNFLEKPYSQQQLLQKVRKVLDQAEPPGTGHASKSTGAQPGVHEH